MIRVSLALALLAGPALAGPYGQAPMGDVGQGAGATMFSPALWGLMLALAIVAVIRVARRRRAAPVMAAQARPAHEAHRARGRGRAEGYLLRRGLRDI